MIRSVARVIIRLALVNVLPAWPMLASDIPILSVCELLESLSYYRHRVVIVVGMEVDSFEGNGAYGRCDKSNNVRIGTDLWPVMVFHRWSSGTIAARTATIPRNATYAKMAELIRSGLESDARVPWLAVQGVVLSPRRLIAPRAKKGEVGLESGNGWGANGSVPAMISVQSYIILANSDRSSRLWLIPRGTKQELPELPPPPVLKDMP